MKSNCWHIQGFKIKSISWGLHPKDKGRSDPKGLATEKKNFVISEDLMLEYYSPVPFHWSEKYLNDKQQSSRFFMLFHEKKYKVSFCRHFNNL